jgi:hypothetical protein
MSNKIYLQLGKNKYHLVNISEQINSKRNDFIKIRLNENTRTETEGLIIVEYSIHPKNTSRKEIISKKVILSGFEGEITDRDNHNINYMNMYKNIGFENFKGEMLVVYQCNYKTFPPANVRIDSKIGKKYLTLDIEYDDPFWLGILFCRNKTKSVEILKENNISEYEFTNCHSGFIVIAVKKLIPEWEKLKVPKDRKMLNSYTWHEKFWLNSIFHSNN